MISAWIDAKPKMRLAVAFAIIALAIAMLGSAAAKPALADEPLTIASQDSADGAIEPGDYYIQSALSGAYMLDISGGSTAANANAQIWSSNKTAAQRWHIARDADGTYTLRCTASDKYLGIASKSPRNGTNVVQLAQNGATARWAIAKSGSTYVLSPSAGPKLALDVAGGTHADGTNVQVYSANGTNAQKWRLIPAKPAVASSRTVANGVYELRFSAASAYALDVKGASSANGANVQLYKRNSSAAQRWAVRWEKDGFYSLRNISSGKALCAAGAGVAAGTNAQQTSFSSSASQRWAIAKRSDGSYTLTCKANGLVLDVAGGRGASGANVRLWQSHDGKSQRFRFERTQILPEGAYIAHRLTSSSKVIGIPRGSAKSGLQAQICAASGALSERLYLRSVDDDTFTIQSVASGLYLTDEKGKVVQRKRSGSANQLWKAALDGNGVSFANVGTGKRMSVSGERLATAKAKSANAQRFRLEQTQLLPDGFYELRNSASGRVLDIAGSSSASGANVQVYKRNTTGAQTWIIHAMGGGWYRLENNGSFKVLGVAGSSKKAHADVRQYAASNIASRLWKPVLLENGGFAFVNKKSGMVLEAAGTGNGANVRQGVRKDAAAQTWKLVDATPISLSGNATLDAYIRGIASRNGYDLRSCFSELMSMRGVSAMDSEVYYGIVGKSTLKKYATYVMNRNESDCYGGAALFTYVARACGYPAQFRASYVPSEGGPEEHGWTEVYIDGQTYICDVSLGRAYHDRNWFLTTYDNAPVDYMI